MRLWRLGNPRDGVFASAVFKGAFGPWSPDRTRERIQPLIIEWEPGSDLVGDFTWTEAGLIVTARVGEALLARFKGFELGPVEMVQDPKLKRPQRVTSRTRRRIWLPYEGPPLYELWVTAWVEPDLARSTLTMLSANRALIEGAEDTETIVAYPEIREVRVPRQPGKGIYVAEGELRDKDIFHLSLSKAYIFCVDEVRQFIVDSGFTNTDVFEMGETF